MKVFWSPPSLKTEDEEALIRVVQSGWLGEGKDLDKIILNKSGSIYVPPDVAHFPQIWRDVKRPCLTMVIMPKGSDMSYTEVVRPELEGNPKL